MTKPIDKRAAVRPMKRRPDRQGKPLRKRAKRVALPDGGIRFSDDQWCDITKVFDFPADARSRLEDYVSIYREELVLSLRAAMSRVFI